MVFIFFVVSLTVYTPLTWMTSVGGVLKNPWRHLDCILSWLYTHPLTVYYPLDCVLPLDCRVTSCLWPILWPVWVGSGNPHDVILTVKWLHSNYLTTPSPFLRNTSLHPKQGQLNQQVREFWIRVRTDLTKGAGLYQEGLLGLNVS